MGETKKIFVEDDTYTSCIALWAMKSYMFKNDTGIKLLSGDTGNGLIGITLNSLAGTDRF